MKIAHFNTFPYGGAATAASRIHTQLNQHGTASQFCFHRNDNDVQTDASHQQINFAPLKSGFVRNAVGRRLNRRRRREIYRQFNKHLANRPPGVEAFTMAELPDPTRLDWKQINADIAHLHWISYFADYPSFFRSIPDAVPLVWTLHDMNAFSGGCHYSNGCHQFRFGCGDCPQVLNRSPQDVSRRSFEVKRKSLQRKQVHVVTPSQWLADLSQQSSIWPEGTSFQTIKYGLDLHQFSPLDKQLARQQLGIDTNAVLIGFGAENVNNVRKGGQHLLAALRQLQSGSAADTKIEGLLFGSGDIADVTGLPRLHQMGFVESIQQQRLIYSAADIVVVPSREDNQPQVGLEAMACGTPVVGFRAGGIPEYVRDGNTGLLADIGDELQLADCIRRLANDPAQRRQLGDQARQMMEKEFDCHQQSQRYIELYQTAISQSRNRLVA